MFHLSIDLVAILASANFVLCYFKKNVSRPHIEKICCQIRLKTGFSFSPCFYDSIQKKKTDNFHLNELLCVKIAEAKQKIKTGMFEQGWSMASTMKRPTISDGNHIIK